MWKTFSRVLPWIPQSLFPPEICPGIICVLEADLKGSCKSCGPICFLSILPLAQVPISDTEDEGSVGNLEFELESCPRPIHPDQGNKRLVWPELHPSNPRSQKQVFTHWGSTVKVQMGHLSRTVVALGWPDSTDIPWGPAGSVQSSPSPSSLQTILPPYLFAEGCLSKIKDQELLWAALLFISPETLIPHARPLWPILSRVDLSFFKGKRSGHWLLASMYNSCLT